MPWSAGSATPHHLHSRHATGVVHLTLGRLSYRPGDTDLAGHASPCGEPSSPRAQPGSVTSGCARRACWGNPGESPSADLLAGLARPDAAMPVERLHRDVEGLFRPARPATRHDTSDRAPDEEIAMLQHPRAPRTHRRAPPPPRPRMPRRRAAPADRRRLRRGVDQGDGPAGAAGRNTRRPRRRSRQARLEAAGRTSRGTGKSRQRRGCEGHATVTAEVVTDATPYRRSRCGTTDHPHR